MRLRAAIALSLAAALAAPAVAGAQAPGCAKQPKTLSPKGSAPKRFTMLLRVNQLKNAQTYANPVAASGGLKGRIRPQDVFVVNTRFARSSPQEWSQIVSTLQAAFPCNRIVALNGLGADPSRPGYAYALHDSGALWALLTDWEKLDWNAARGTAPWMGRWTGRFRKTRKRVRRWVGGLASAFAQSRATRARRAGLVPQFRSKWDYGMLAREVSGPNRLLGAGRRGIQSVQTQDACAYGGGRAMKRIAGGLLREYQRANYKRVKLKRKGSKRGGKHFRHVKRKWKTRRGNLGLQISFSNTPNPAAGMALLRTSPERASKCTRTALKRGGGAFLYWASPDSMRSLFATPRICSLRPSPDGIC